MSVDSETHNLRYNTAILEMEAAEIKRGFAIVNGVGAKLGKDGNAWFYGVGHLPEPDSIYAFGNTPENALFNFICEWRGIKYNKKVE